MRAGNHVPMVNVVNALRGWGDVYEAENVMEKEQIVRGETRKDYQLQ